MKVDYELSNTEPFYTRLEDTRGTLVFEDGVEEQTITFRIFKRHKYEPDDFLSTFKMELFNPVNTELGNTPKMVIYYYDDEKLLNDVDATQITLESTPNVMREHELLIGIERLFNIRCMHFYSMPKINGKDLFIARFLYQNGTEAEILLS